MNVTLTSVLLLAAVTALYAGYNVFLKVSGSYVPPAATSTVVATICLQLAALFVSCCFYLMLVVHGGYEFGLSREVYIWAIVAGVCIGLAEIGYLYLFSGIGGGMPGSVAIPIVVGGTIVISLFLSSVFLHEQIRVSQWLGAGMVVGGVVLIFYHQGG